MCILRGCFRLRCASKGSWCVYLLISIRCRIALTISMCLPFFFMHTCVAMFLQGVALQNIALALAVVFLSIALLSGFALAGFVSSLVLGTTLGTVGLVHKRLNTMKAKRDAATLEAILFFGGAFCFGSVCRGGPEERLPRVGRLRVSSQSRLIPPHRSTPMKTSVAEFCSVSSCHTTFDFARWRALKIFLAAFPMFLPPPGE